jgi:hypothetical protein
MAVMKTYWGLALLISVISGGCDPTHDLTVRNDLSQDFVIQLFPPTDTVIPAHHSVKFGQRFFEGRDEPFELRDRKGHVFGLEKFELGGFESFHSGKITFVIDKKHFQPVTEKQPRKAM